MPEQARTVLAFDFGIKRIGVAVGEAELGTAHPLPGIAAPGEIPSTREKRYLETGQRVWRLRMRRPGA